MAEDKKPPEDPKSDHPNAAQPPDDVPGWEYESEITGINDPIGPAEPDADLIEDPSNVIQLPRKRSIFAKPEADFPPFPSSVWTGLFYDYADLIAPTTEASEAGIWAAHAAGLSLLLSRTCGLPWGTSVMFPTLHVAILGPTGAGRKTASIDDAVKILVRPYMPVPTQPGEPDPCVILNGMGSGEGFMEAIRDMPWRDPGAKKNTPPHIQTGRSALFVIPELGGLMEKTAAGAAGSMTDFIINAWDCKEEWTHQTRTTKDSAPFKATNATAVILAASTIEWLGATLQTTHVRNGLVNRFLWMAGNPRAPISIRPSIDLGKLQAYQQRVNWSLAAVRGNQFALTPVAAAYHDSRYKTLYYLRNDRTADDSNAMTIAATGRTDVMALRVAMIIATSLGTLTIDDKIIEAAWDIVDYSNKIVDILLTAIAPRTLSDMYLRVLRHARTAAEKASEKGHDNGMFSRSDVFRRTCKGKGGMPPVDFGKIFDSMIREGDVVRVQRTGKGEWYRLGEGAFEVLDPGGLH